MKELKKLILKHNLLINCIFALFSVGMSILLFLISKKTEDLVDGIFNNNFNSFYLILAFSFCLLYVLFDFIYNVLYRKSELKSELITKEFCYSKYFNLPYNVAEKIDDGDFLFRLNMLTPTIASYFNSFFIQIGLSLITFIVVMGTVFYYSWIIGIIVFVLFTSLILFTYLCSNSIAKKEDELETVESYENNYLTDSHKNFFSIKNYFLKEKFTNIYKDKTIKSKYKIMNKKNLFYSLYIVTYDLLILILPIVILFIGILLTSSNIITIGAILGIYSILGAIQDPLRNLADSITNYKDVQIKKKRFDYLEYSNVLNEDININSISISGDFYLDKVKTPMVFNYGENYLIKGESGIGKSTIFKVIMGLRKEDNIELNINDSPFKESYLNSIYKQCIYVEQNARLFNMSLKDNILVFEDVNDKLYEEIIKVTVLDKFIDLYGENKIIDDDTNISGGELLRISLARALLKKPKFLLLDEITSQLDFETSKVLVKNLIEYSKKNGISMIIISHKNEFEDYIKNIIRLEGKSNV